MSRDRHADAVWHNHIATRSVQGLSNLSAFASIAPAPRRSSRPGLSVVRTTSPIRLSPTLVVLCMAIAIAAALV